MLLTILPETGKEFSGGRRGRGGEETENPSQWLDKQLHIRAWLLEGNNADIYPPHAVEATAISSEYDCGRFEKKAFF